MSGRWTIVRRRIYLVALAVFCAANAASLWVASRNYNREAEEAVSRSYVDGATMARMFDTLHAVLRAEAMTVLAAVWLFFALRRSLTDADNRFGRNDSGHTSSDSA